MELEYRVKQDEVSAAYCCSLLVAMVDLPGLDMVAASCAKKIVKNWAKVQELDECGVLLANPAAVRLLIGGMSGAMES